MVVRSSIADFALLIYKLLHNDMDVTLGTGGFTGVGKSTFNIVLMKEYSKLADKNWTFADNCTWSRAEFKTWINGDKKTPRKTQYSALLLDELFSMFYRRNWHNDSQKEGISILNMCRDRHLFIAGNVPNFWDLDGGFVSRVRYYVYIPTRGTAWVFQQENNPFSSDPWNVLNNKKLFRMGKGKPYRLPNFVTQIEYPDLTPEDKGRYLNIRNVKRVQAQEDVKHNKVEKYGLIKKDRDNLIRALHLKHKVKQVDIRQYISLNKTTISNICLGIH